MGFKPEELNTYDITTQAMSGASVTLQEHKLEGIGCVVIGTGNLQGVGVRFNDPANLPIPLRKKIVWAQPFKYLYLDYSASDEGEIKIITQLTGDKLNLDLNHALHDVIREQHSLSAVAISAAQTSEQLNTPKATITIGESGLANVNYGVKTTLGDSPASEDYIDVAFPTLLTAGTTDLIQIAHAVGKIVLTYQRAAGDVAFDYRIMTHRF